MNGRTTIDAIINPCSAAMDKQTYGIRLLNVSTYGERLVRVGILGITIDLFWAGWRCWVYARLANAAVMFCPFGSVTWLMPDKMIKFYSDRKSKEG